LQANGMEIGIVGLGRMGANMARRLARAGVRVVGFDRDSARREALRDEGIVAAAESIPMLAGALTAPRVVWLMVPAGSPTELAIEDAWPELARGDLIVDGGNAHYKDSQRRAAALLAAGIDFIDCGVSGGVFGLANGYTLMYGANSTAAHAILPYLRILAPAPDRGYLHCGPPGAGHFVKMIHNGIEYGMMQAYAEGFALLKNKQAFDLDVAAIAETWRHGSVVRSWLLDLIADFLRGDPDLSNVAAVVADSGEGRWTVQEAVEQGVPAPVLSLALMARFASQGRDDYAGKLLAMMRQGFGGHGVQKLGGGAE
jgi:6-phosphogluconate dehydrogenase